MTKTMPNKDKAASTAAPTASSPDVVKRFPHAAGYGVCAFVVVILCVLLGFSFSKMQGMVHQSQVMQAQYNAMMQQDDDVVLHLESLRKQWQAQEADVAALRVAVDRVQHNKQQARAAWQIVEVTSLVNAANHAVYFNRDPAVAMALLAQAKQQLNGLNSTAALQARQAISADLAALKQVTSLDVTDVYVQLQGVSAVIDGLPLLGSEASHNPASPVVPAAGAVTGWRAFWQASIAKIQRLIVIRHDTEGVVPVIGAAQRDFYYQYLQSCVARAKWAVLHHDQTVYQASLDDAVVWLKRYFIVTETEVQSVLDAFAALQQVTWSNQLPDLDQSVAAITVLSAEGV